MNEKFPVDTVTLSILREALETTLDVDEEGNPFPVGGGITVSKFLDTLSPMVPSLESEDDDRIVELIGTGWSLEDVCRALIDEIFVLRLKLNEPEDFSK